MRVVTNEGQSRFYFYTLLQDNPEITPGPVEPNPNNHATA